MEKLPRKEHVCTKHQNTNTRKFSPAQVSKANITTLLFCTREYACGSLRYHYRWEGVPTRNDEPKRTVLRAPLIYRAIYSHRLRERNNELRYCSSVLSFSSSIRHAGARCCNREQPRVNAYRSCLPTSHLYTPLLLYNIAACPSKHMRYHSLEQSKHFQTPFPPSPYRQEKGVVF